MTCLSSYPAGDSFPWINTKCDTGEADLSNFDKRDGVPESDSFPWINTKREIKNFDLSTVDKRDDLPEGDSFPWINTKRDTGISDQDGLVKRYHIFPLISDECVSF